MATTSSLHETASVGAPPQLATEQAPHLAATEAPRTDSPAPKSSPADSDVRQVIGPPQSRSKRWLWRSLVLLLLAASVGVLLWLRQRGQQVEQPQYVFQEVRRGELKAIVTATGTLEALDQVDVGAELSGRVVSVNADFNDRVKQGQVLCELDSAQQSAAAKQARAQLAANRASLKSAQATVAELELTLKRNRALNADGILARQDLDATEASFERAKAAVQLAKAQIVLARAALESAQTALEKTVIRAPISGVVLSRNVEPGQTVAATLSSPVLFTLARDLTRMELHIDVDEADVGQVRKGQVASFSVDAYPGRVFPAELTAVHNSATTKDNVVTYEALLLVNNDDLALRPGMTATVTIVTADRHDALLVPNTALRFTPPAVLARDQAGPRFGLFRGRPSKDNAKPPKTQVAISEHAGTVWVLSGNAPQKVALKLGLTDGTWTEVVSGKLSAETPVLVDVIAEGD